MQGQIVSRNGTCMRSFRLHDHAGKWVLCTAFGRHAENESIQYGNEVIMFFANAQAGLNNGPGQLWLYDESHIVLLRTECQVPSARLQMEMKGDK